MESWRSGRSLGDRMLLLAVVVLAIAWIAPIVWVVGLSFKPNEVLMRSTGGIILPPLHAEELCRHPGRQFGVWLDGQ
jgi:ABC-type glycerol-3-phosphate transport system permease component